MSYQTMRFVNLPEQDTPIDEDSLNNILEGIDELFELVGERLNLVEVDYAANVFDTHTNANVFYTTTNAGTSHLFITIEKNTSSTKTQFKLSPLGLQKRTKSNNTWGPWASAVPAGTLGATHLSNSLLKTTANANTMWLDPSDTSIPTTALVKAWILNAISGKRNTSDAIGYDDLSSTIKEALDNSVEHLELVVDDLAELNSANYTSPTRVISLSIVGNAAIALGVEGGTLGKLRTVEADGNYERYISIPSIAGVKWHQTVNSIAPSWSATSWERKSQAVTPSLSLGFDSNFKATKAVNSSSLTVGNFTSNEKYVFVSSKVTSISSQFLFSATAVTDIYVDNIESGITIADDVKANVNIHYRGSFNIMDFLALSLVRLGN